MNLIHKINWQLWLGIAITTLFIAVLLYRVRFEEVILTVRQANYLFVVPAIGIYFVAIYFRALRWRYILLSSNQIGHDQIKIPICLLGVLATFRPSINHWKCRSKVGRSRSGQIVRRMFTSLGMLDEVDTVTNANAAPKTTTAPIPR